MKKNVILVPDVHGRDFWRELIPFIDECERVVFLGDYHDPYQHEGISNATSLNNFKEILSFAKEHQDKVVLLLGNHDLSYYNRTTDDSWDVGANRYDMQHQEEVKSLFRDNNNLFAIIEMIELPEIDRKFLLSHAGVHPQWINEAKALETIDPYNITNIYIKLTELFGQGSREFKSSLMHVGWSRGGFNKVGSMVWADCHEFFMEQTPFTQVFGHTQQLKVVNNTYVPDEPYISGTNVCIDCHQCFYIDEEGSIRNLKTDEIIY